MAETSTARKVFLIGLHNAHAMEKQAISIMEPQVKRLEHYPEMQARLQQHITETEGQIARLDEILAGNDEGTSSVKDKFLEAVGSMASMSHATASDEVLKNTFANFAFENYEAAAYESLIACAESCGETTAVTLLRQNLEEERQMARWIESNVRDVTARYVSLESVENTGGT